VLEPEVVIDGEIEEDMVRLDVHDNEFEVVTEGLDDAE